MESIAVVKDSVAIAPTVIFLHLPKAGGTTLARILERHSDKATTFHYISGRPGHTVQDLQALPESQRQAIAFVRGHVWYGFHEYFSQPCAYITMLRDPVERVISYYYFVKQSPRQGAHELVNRQNMSLEDFVNSRFSIDLDNLQTRRLAGKQGNQIPFGHCSTDLLDMAKANLRDGFAAVGITERFDESVLLFKQVLGWTRPMYASLNITSNKPSSQMVSPTTRAMIQAQNELDCQLYGYAQQLLDQRLHQWGESFQVELKVFQTLNLQFSEVQQELLHTKATLKETRATIHRLKAQVEHLEHRLSKSLLHQAHRQWIRVKRKLQDRLPN